MSLTERLWKYAALGASSIVFEEANPIFGGIAVHHGRAEIVGVIAAVAIGTWAASIILYFVGYWKIDWVRARWPDRQRLLDGALAIVSRHPWRASLSVRFAYGLRLPLPISCGAARLPFALYALASGISSWAWATAFALLGYWAGGFALVALAFTRRGDVRLVTIGALCLIFLLFVARRRRIAERTAKVLTGENIAIMTTAERATPIIPLRRIREGER
jgi:membrane protein DedA with SNARE-associated domain